MTERAPTIWRFLRASPLFWSLVALKLVLGTFATSHYPSDLFIPFVNYFVESGFQDPWKHFTAQGLTAAFPYPPPMLYALALPRFLLDPFLPDGVFTVSMGHLVTLRLPLLAADLAILSVLLAWFPAARRRVLLLYWASPVMMYILYWHGQLDVIPTALLVVALHLIRTDRITAAMGVYAASLAMKSHLWVLLPFAAVYVHQRRSIAGTVKVFSLAVAGYLVMLVPFGFSSAFLSMVYRNPEQLRALALRIPLGFAHTIVVLPLAITVLWLRFVTYEKRNWDLFMLYAGLAMSSFILLAPPAPGYFAWSIPFILYYLAGSARVSLAPYLIFSGAYLAYCVVAGPAFVGPPPKSWPGPLGEWLATLPAVATLLPEYATPVILSILDASLAVIAFQMYRSGVRSNDIYRFLDKHLVVGIAGDSGAGKSYLARLLANAMGSGESSVVAGDNYHRWSRGDRMWKRHTHLDARANELHAQYEDLLKLSHGQVVVTQVYDHGTGKFRENQVIRPGRFILLEGLHALMHRRQLELFVLRLFVEPAETLRKAWKTRRDVGERGYRKEQVNRALGRRVEDRQRFILPQRRCADVIVAFQPRRGKDGELALELTAHNHFNWRAAVARLAECPTLEVEHDPYRDFNWQHVTIAGTIPAELIGEIATEVIPNIDELFGSRQFEAGINGCLQLLALICVSDRVRFTRRTSEASAVAMPEPERGAA